MRNVGFVGLGVMGAPMALHLHRAGSPVLVWARRPERAAEIAAEGPQAVETLAELGERCDLVFLCVNRTQDVEECLAGLTERASPGALFVDHSTIEPSGARRLHGELANRGFGFVDAPITGGSMGAQSGRLIVFCGGDEVPCASAIEAMRPYALRAERVGGPGAGQMMKMANQIAVGGALLALCESMAFAAKAGLDLDQTRELLAGGAAGSWAFDNYGPKILAKDWSPGFTVANQRKDFGYCLHAAAEIDAAVPGTILVDRLLAALEVGDGADKTTAALFETLLNMGFES
jgi:3-hydroxyisobutyrate dehydrogenase-like beta-hydroxyacid dehydrogenase